MPDNCCACVECCSVGEWQVEAGMPVSIDEVLCFIDAKACGAETTQV